ncbi:MAG: short-chain dehydrogenase [Rhizobiales bacterium NRL2]|nr:MAG: short-chain dehydrogenase [Rhizobiales bacterium NRL2]
MSLEGRVALVSGGAGHIGQAIATGLTELGAAVALLDRADEVNEIAAGLDRASGHVVDLSDERATRRALVDAAERHGRMDILINNAAFVGTSDLTGWAEPFEGQSTETWRKAIEVNLTAAFALCQEATPHLRASGSGAILNVASIYGALGPDWSFYEGTQMANPAAYAASKGGLIQLTRWLATTLAPEIRVNAICPGGVGRGQPESFVKRYEARTPLGRMANENDIAGAVVFLVSDTARYITGQVLMVDGGFSAW